MYNRSYADGVDKLWLLLKLQQMAQSLLEKLK